MGINSWMHSLGFFYISALHTAFKFAIVHMLLGSCSQISHLFLIGLLFYLDTGGKLKPLKAPKGKEKDYDEVRHTFM